MEWHCSRVECDEASGACPDFKSFIDFCLLCMIFGDLDFKKIK